MWPPVAGPGLGDSVVERAGNQPTATLPAPCAGTACPSSARQRQRRHRLQPDGARRGSPIVAGQVPRERATWSAGLAAGDRGGACPPRQLSFAGAGGSKLAPSEHREERREQGSAVQRLARTPGTRQSRSSPRRCANRSSATSRTAVQPDEHRTPWRRRARAWRSRRRRPTGQSRRARRLQCRRRCPEQPDRRQPDDTGVPTFQQRRRRLQGREDQGRCDS